MFFIEANETSSLVMTNILYHLAKYKHVQDKLRKEVDEAFKEGEITFEKLHEMPYLNGVFLGRWIQFARMANPSAQK